MTDVIYLRERRGISNEQSRHIIDGVIKKEIVSEYTNSMFRYSSRYDRATKRGKSRSDAYHAEQKQRRIEFHFNDERNEIIRNHSDRTDETLDNRFILANALESAVQKDEEKIVLDAYKS